MATGTAKQREQERLADAKFPTQDKNFTIRPLESPRQQIERVRNGSLELASVPWILPGNRGVVEAASRNLNEGRFDRSNREDVQRYRELIVKSNSGDQRDPEVLKARTELASYRTFELNNDVMATPWAMSAFQQVNLNPDEQPLIERPRSRNLQRFTVTSVGINGGTRQAQWRTTKSAETAEIELLATERVQYQIMDLQQGDVSQLDAINRELQYDMERKLDTLAKTNLDAAKVVSGLRDTLSIDADVTAANIPDTNYLDLDTAYPGNAGVLTLPKLKAILLHVSKFGSAGFADQPISISNIMMSPQNLQDPWDFTDLVYAAFDGSGDVAPSDTVPQSVRDDIFRTGMMTSAWGHNFAWTPNSQLAKGKMYVLTGQPIGWAFMKPVFDRMLEWNEQNSADHADLNQGEVMWKKAISFYTVDVWQYRVVIIDL